MAPVTASKDIWEEGEEMRTVVSIQSTAAGLSLRKGSRRPGCWEYLSRGRLFRVSLEEVVPGGGQGQTGQRQLLLLSQAGWT